MDDVPATFTQLLVDALKRTALEYPDGECNKTRYLGHLLRLGDTTFDMSPAEILEITALLQQADATGDVLASKLLLSNLIILTPDWPNPFPHAVLADYLGRLEDRATDFWDLEWCLVFCGWGNLAQYNPTLYSPRYDACLAKMEARASHWRDLIQCAKYLGPTSSRATVLLARAESAFKTNATDFYFREQYTDALLDCYEYEPAGKNRVLIDAEKHAKTESDWLVCAEWWRDYMRNESRAARSQKKADHIRQKKLSNETHRLIGKRPIMTVNGEWLTDAILPTRRERQSKRNRSNPTLQPTLPKFC